MCSDGCAGPLIQQLLRLPWQVKIQQVEKVLEPYLEEWLWRPQLATEAFQTLAQSSQSRPSLAWQLLEVLRRKKLGPTFVHYNAAIHAAGKQGHWVTALTIFDSMRIYLVMPDLTSCNSAMSFAKWDVACQLFGKLSEFELLPDHFAFNSVAAALKGMRRWQLAWWLQVFGVEEGHFFEYRNNGPTGLQVFPRG